MGSNVFAQSRVIMPAGVMRTQLNAQAMGTKSVRVRARLVRRGVVAAAMVIACALAFVWTRVRVVQVGYEVSELNQQVTELKRQKDQLEVDVARLKSPDRLEKVAVAHFGMRPPGAGEIVFIEGAGEQPAATSRVKKDAAVLPATESATKASAAEDARGEKEVSAEGLD